MPVDKLTLIIEWLRGKQAPSMKAILQAFGAVYLWAISLVPDEKPSGPSIMGLNCGDDRIKMAEHLEMLMAPQAADFKVPAWLLPLLAQVLGQILTHGW